MRLPSSIFVFGLSIKVVEISPCLDDDDNEVDGTFDGKSLTISIEKKLTPEEKLHTLIHELGHALFHRTSIGQTKIDSQIEEIIVNNYATLVTEVFSLRFKRKPRKTGH